MLYVILSGLVRERRGMLISFYHFAVAVGRANGGSINNMFCH